VRLQHPDGLVEILADAGQDIRRIGIARLVGGLDALVDLLGERRIAVQQRLHMVHPAVRFVGQAGARVVSATVCVVPLAAPPRCTIAP
jgi:hypothetical protein